MPEFEDLRSAVPGPSPDETRQARARLRDEIARGRSGMWRPGHGWRAAVAGALLITVAFAGWLVFAPREAEAGLERIAAAIERIPVSQLPAGTYHYVRIDETAIGRLQGDALPEAGVSQFAVRVESTREVWVAEDGSIVERFTATSAVPLNEDLVDAFASSGIPESLGVGTTTTAAYPPDPNRIPPDLLPTDPGELEEWMRGEVAILKPDEFPARLLDLAAQLLADPASPPALRAAVLRVLDSAGGLLIEQVGVDREVSVTATDRTDGATLERSIYINDDGRVSRGSLTNIGGDPAFDIPPNTVIESTRYQYAAAVTDAPL